MNFETTVETLLEYTHKKQIRLLARKPINYGIQLKFSDGSAEIPVNVYNGKKGVSVVVGGSHCTLKEQLQLFTGTKKTAACGGAAIAAGQNFQVAPAAVWAGADEAGKGDFFGPLVVAAVSLDNNTALQLRSAGVADCKKLTDFKVVKLAGMIRSTAGVYYSVNCLAPELYNRKYSEFSAGGRNLNDLLASLHAACAAEILEADKRITKYIVDKFASDVVLGKWLKIPEGIQLVNIPKAESDIAVAAASVLARAAFLEELKRLGDEYGVELPKGAGAHVNSFAACLAGKYDINILEKLTKKHFKNSLDVAGILRRCGE